MCETHRKDWSLIPAREVCAANVNMHSRREIQDRIQVNFAS